MPNHHIRLDGPTIERFIETSMALQALVARFDSRAEGETDLTAQFERDARARAEATALLRDRGYASVESWQATMLSIAMAYEFAVSSGGLASLIHFLRGRIEETRANPHLNEDRKREAIAQLEGEIEQVERMRPPPENIEAVRPYIARLRPLFGNE